MQTITGKWFECKVRMNQMGEDGLVKKVTEVYCVQAESFTEAECVMIGLFGQECNELEVQNINPAQYKEVTYAGEPKDTDMQEKWWKAKVAFITLDEKTGKEKRTVQTYLLEAMDMDGAGKVITELFGGSMGGYVKVSCAETRIITVYAHN